MNKKNNRSSLSLVQTISTVFISITLLVIILSVTSIKGLEQVENQFNGLSDKALPLAMTNAKLTQSILEQIKQLGYGTQVESLEELTKIQTETDSLIARNTQLMETVFSIAADFDSALTPQQEKQLKKNIAALASQTQNILADQAKLLNMQDRIDGEVSEFRYGLSSIGPEMNRISSFLSGDNPASQDAANRFSASASSMESTFLVLMMQTDIDKAMQEYKEMRNRIAGINLAFDDFAEWHPETIELLNGVSTTAESLIDDSKSVVSSTINNIVLMLIIGGLVIVAIIVCSWVALRAWIKVGLVNVLSHLSRLTEHDFTQSLELRGPFELKEVARKLNQVIESTRDSISTVTRNCETLYQTAEISHGAAEITHQSLTKQNESLLSMVTTVTQLEASIREIATVTNESYSESNLAAEHSSSGVEAIEQNQVRLQSLEHTLNINEESMLELDSRVKQIREMVDMIAGIADSTNLLALNAAIEAARAGEQGCGFAVVADEVRKLARDTSDQTGNIRERMNELVAAAEKSRSAVESTRTEMTYALESSEQVKQTFADIANAVEHIRTRVEQITVATEEQERATADVSRSISHITEQGEQTKLQVDSMVESSEQVAEIAGHQQAMLHKYELHQQV
ncbi:methyl-accepting chemotaxis protein [Vibrio hepatarius]|uniref:methyl-accepting chemotaxis protein n=1 Tax=Vibrio hepatarius TaxID=171383 RepID=UPI00148D737D|nr:methyl-accepting chemotaxis protein [Vibrio hepatarius]NOI13058.1 methyl-accepting chemotaxis protein [Vibrio hepatarius]